MVMLGYWYRLYSNMTNAETALEPAIAALGERYRSQHPFLKLKLFADFALLDRHLIIEVDGASHDTPSQKKKDLVHMLALRSEGWNVVRVSNEFATVDPVGAVSACLRAPQTTLEELQADLERLLQNYPHLAVVAAKRPKRPRQPPPAKSAAARPARSRATPARDPK